LEALERAEMLNYRHGPCGLSFVLNGSASNCRGERVTVPAARANLLLRFTMSDVSTLSTVLEATSAALQAQEQEEAPEQEAPEQVEEREQEEEQAPEQDEKQLNALLRKAESAFTKGNKGLLLSRVECGKWCNEVYILRAAQGHKDRSFTSQLIFNRLAVHADSRRECDGSILAKLFKTVDLLAEGDNWKSLSLGKLEDLCSLVNRADGSEEYAVCDASKAEQAKALFTWACGDGLKRPSRDDIQSRVLELTNPAKYAEKQAERERKANETASAKQGAGQEEAPDAPENLIATEVQTRPAPNWKDVPDGMAALFQEGCKQQPGHSSDMMRDFAKQFVWTSAMVKGLIAGIADSKDGEAAEKALQTLVDAIAEEYSIFPAAELAEAA
jgi:hypothetical protein